MLTTIVRPRLRFTRCVGSNRSTGHVNNPSCSSLSRLSSCAAVTYCNIRTFQPRFRDFLEPEERPWSARRLLFGKTLRKSIRECSSSTTQTIQYNLSPNIPKTEGRKLYFDTHTVVCVLEDNGFTTQQAEALVSILVQMSNSNMDIIYADMVTKVQQEIMLQRVMSQISSVKKDMIILEKSEFSTLLAENEKLKIQLLQLKVQIADIMNKVRSDNLMDMNLEKSRVKELKAEHDKRLLETRTEIMEMTAEHECHLTQTNMKIDTEVAGLKTMLESHKLDTIKYMAGSIFTCLTVVLGFYRIWM
ncbi:unnamed protein product [Knipowitschia caucasica]